MEIPELISWADLVKEKPKEQHFLLNPYIPRQGKVMLWGNTSIGKSPLTWNMAYCIGEGKEFFGFPTEQSNVLVIELDSTRNGTRNRLAKWARGHHPESVGFVFIPGGMAIPHPATEHTTGILKAIEALKPGLVIINSLAKCHDMDPKDTKTVKQVYGWFDQVCGPDRAYLFVHHERKSPGDPNFYDPEREKFSGSKGWLDSAQVGIQLRKFDGEGGGSDYLRLYHHKSQESELVAPLELHLESDGTHITCPKAKELYLIQEYLNANQDLSARDLDRGITKMLPHLSERTGRRRRNLLENQHFPGFDWVKNLENADFEKEGQK